MLRVPVEQLDQAAVLVSHPMPVRFLEPVVLQVNGDIVQRRLQVGTRRDTRQLRHQAVELRLVPQRGRPIPRSSLEAASRALIGKLGRKLARARSAGFSRLLVFLWALAAAVCLLALLF